MAGDVRDLEVVAPYHSYSVGHVKLFLDFVLSATTGLRGAARVMTVVKEFFKLPMFVPSWHSGRLWLMRVGYYKLTRAKQITNDWVWIIDHSIQLGSEKCLVILGLRLCDLPAPGQCLQHKHVELIELLPVNKSNGDVVYEQLKETTKKTGVPRVIVSDHGSDLKAGINLFCNDYPQTAHVYDLKHKIASMLKSRWAQDDTWMEFTKYANQVKKQLQQTSLAHLAPPNQRSKARYMNLDRLIRWGKNIQMIVDQPSQEQEKIKKKLGQIVEYKEDLEQWGEMLQIAGVLEKHMHAQGLEKDGHIKLKSRLQEQCSVIKSQEALEMMDELLKFTEEQEFQCNPGERFPASSEVIESVFGKQKYLEQEQSKNGFTGLLLGIGAIVSTTDSDVIKDALETVRTKDVLKWCKEKIGESVQARRRRVFSDVCWE
jgi:hypothetical protein